MLALDAHRRGLDEMIWCTYILRCADGELYYGIARDLRRRLREHYDGRVRSTKPRRPMRLVWYEEFDTAAQARRRERSFKNGRTRQKTIKLLIAGFPPEKLAPFARGACQGLAQLQRILSTSLWADSSSGALRRAAEREPGLSEEERRLIAAVDPEGFDLAGILAKKLRFEQVLRGEPALSKSFAADPEAFTAAFKRYAREAPARHFTAAEEAEAFRSFCEGAGIVLPAGACEAPETTEGATCVAPPGKQDR